MHNKRARHLQCIRQTAGIEEGMQHLISLIHQDFCQLRAVSTQVLTHRSGRLPRFQRLDVVGHASCAAFASVVSLLGILYVLVIFVRRDWRHQELDKVLLAGHKLLNLSFFIRNTNTDRSQRLNAQCQTESTPESRCATQCASWLSQQACPRTQLLPAPPWLPLLLP